MQTKADAGRNPVLAAASDPKQTLTEITQSTENMPNCLTKRITVAVTLIALALLWDSSVNADEEWYVHYGWTSGYGYDEGILVSSDGRVGQVTDALFDKFDECPAVSLNAVEISELQRLIDQIPTSIPNNSHTRILDHCHDEREHRLVVSFGNKKQIFQYSQDSRCLNDDVPPDWMEDLVEHLASYYENVGDCDSRIDDLD